MKCLRVAAGVLAQTPLDWRGNARRVLSALHAARDEGVSLLCLPELCLTGYGCEDTFASADLLRRAWELLEHVEAESRDLVVAVGLPIRYHNAVFNAAALLCDGSLLGLVAKRFLAGDGIHYEPRWFKPWEEGRRTLLRQGGREVPLGDLLFDLGGVRVGFEICEDAWVANRPGAVLARRGVDLLLNPSASHFAFGKRDIRRRFILEGSRALCCSYLYANLLGNEAGRAIYDGSALLASNGHVIAEGARFSFKDWGLCVGEVDIDATRTAAARSANSRPLLVEEGDVLRAEFAWPTRRPPLVAPALPAWELAGSLEYEEFTRAVALGLFDYLRKSRSRGFVLSLSGGADSSTVACLVHIAVRLALSELGVEGLRGRLSYLDDLPVTEDPRAWTRRLLLCAYQATAQSSHTTLDAARAVADAVGARFVLLDVEPIVAAYIARVAEALGRPLDWSHDDLALQNIQARARGPGVWMLANVEGALLLAT
jgi:NAD+ synthase (glutamine-hydrolysing)